MSIRRPLARTWGSKALATVCTLPLVVGVTGCAGTPWGESLSGSFPTPPGQPAPPEQAQAGEATPAETPSAPAPLSATSPPPEGAARLPETGAGSPQLPAQPGAAPSRPAGSKAPGASARQPPAVPKPKPIPSSRVSSPYRVTIRLPQADPSAPAEGVTQALRAAGIPFEVETIERVKGPAAAPLPEAPQGSVPSPSVRPAPPPR